MYAAAALSLTRLTVMTTNQVSSQILQHRSNGRSDKQQGSERLLASHSVTEHLSFPNLQPLNCLPNEYQSWQVMTHSADPHLYKIHSAELHERELDCNPHERTLTHRTKSMDLDIQWIYICLVFKAFNTDEIQTNKVKSSREKLSRERRRKGPKLPSMLQQWLKVWTWM